MAGRGTRDWDAATYDRVSTPQQQWATAIVDRLGLTGDESFTMRAFNISPAGEEQLAIETEWSPMP